MRNCNTANLELGNPGGGKTDIMWSLAEYENTGPRTSVHAKSKRPQNAGHYSGQCHDEAYSASTIRPHGCQGRTSMCTIIAKSLGFRPTNGSIRDYVPACSLAVYEQRYASGRADSRECISERPMRAVFWRPIPGQWRECGRVSRMGCWRNWAEPRRLQRSSTMRVG